MPSLGIHHRQQLSGLDADVSEGLEDLIAATMAHGDGGGGPVRTHAESVDLLVRETLESACRYDRDWCALIWYLETSTAVRRRVPLRCEGVPGWGGGDGATDEAVGGQRVMPAVPRPPSLEVVRAPVDLDEHADRDVGTIHNMVFTISVNTTVDMHHNVMRMRRFADFNPLRFPAVIIRLRNPHVTTLTFKRGKMVVMGCTSRGAALLGAAASANLLGMHGQAAEHVDLTIHNVVSTVDVGIPVNMNFLAHILSQDASYEPDLFPGLIYRTPMTIGGYDDVDIKTGARRRGARAHRDAKPTTTTTTTTMDVRRANVAMLIFPSAKIVMTGCVDEAGPVEMRKFVRWVRRVSALCHRYPSIADAVHVYTKTKHPRAQQQHAHAAGSNNNKKRSSSSAANTNANARKKARSGTGRLGDCIMSALGGSASMPIPGQRIPTTTTKTPASGGP